jgi:predicted nucleic acid-binding protein
MSGFLRNTNVISELVKPKPEPDVTARINATDEELLSPILVYPYSIPGRMDRLAAEVPL